MVDERDAEWHRLRAEALAELDEISRAHGIELTSESGAISAPMPATRTRPGVRRAPAIGARVRNPPEIGERETRIASEIISAFQQSPTASPQRRS